MAALAEETIAKGEGGGDRKDKRFKGVFKALKGELAACKTRWDKEIKIFFKRPPPPWPVRCVRVIPKTVSEVTGPYDMHEIRIQLLVSSPDRSVRPLPIQAEVVQKDMPAALRRAIAKKVSPTYIRAHRIRVLLFHHFFFLYR